MGQSAILEADKNIKEEPMSQFDHDKLIIINKY